MFSQSSSKCLARFMVLDESKEAALVIHLFGIVILGVQSCSDIWQTTFHFPSRLRAEFTREIYPSISVLEKHEVHEIYKLASQSSVNVINAIWVADRFDCGLGRAAHHSKEFWQKRKEEKNMINRMIALFNKYISSEVWQHNASSSAIHFWVTSFWFPGNKHSVEIQVSITSMSSMWPFLFSFLQSRMSWQRKIRHLPWAKSLTVFDHKALSGRQSRRFQSPKVWLPAK